MELVTSTSLTEHQSSQDSKEEKNISANPQKTTPSSPVYAVHLFCFILRLTEIKTLCQRLRPFLVVFGALQSNTSKCSCMKYLLYKHRVNV